MVRRALAFYKLEFKPKFDPTTPCLGLSRGQKNCLPSYTQHLTQCLVLSEHLSHTSSLLRGSQTRRKGKQGPK